MLKPRAKGARDTQTTRLTEPEIAAIEILLSGGTYKAAAEVAHVHEYTVRRWMTQPQYTAFQDEYRMAVEAQRKRMEGRLISRIDPAMEVVDKILDPQSFIGLQVPEMQLRLKAATWVLDKMLPEGEGQQPITAVQVNVNTAIPERVRQAIEQIRVHNPENAARLEARYLKSGEGE